MTLKVGIIGVGGIARTHMPGWEASPHAEVVAGADVSEAALRTWGERFGVTCLVTDSTELIEDPAIDIIDLHYGPDSRTNEYWHTAQDNLDHVSPLSLKIVGDVVLESLPHIADRAAGD